MTMTRFTKYYLATCLLAFALLMAAVIYVEIRF